jgi:hypothetical protein
MFDLLDQIAQLVRRAKPRTIAAGGRNRGEAVDAYLHANESGIIAVLGANPRRHPRQEIVMPGGV